MSTIEQANNSRKRDPQAIEAIPEFRRYLQREGLSLAQWEARQRAAPRPGLDSAALDLRRRYVDAKARR